ncbi:MAG TPA: hypothetical protein ENL17_00575 [Candidatus Methanoperedenaceae archaeon]|nr:hypothetical protein [Candidatus Methanoperedenaceae archaeon]
MEIPILSAGERQQICREMWTGMMLGNTGFIMRKLGPDALDELSSEVASGCASDMKARGVDDPVKFAMNYAVVNKNVFGSEGVSVEGYASEAVFTTATCANLATAMEFGSKGMPITKEDYCNGCIDGYFKRVAENLGFGLEAEFTEKGCRIKIHR